jgi:hypothetical protein
MRAPGHLLAFIAIIVSLPLSWWLFAGSMGHDHWPHGGAGGD